MIYMGGGKLEYEFLLSFLVILWIPAQIIDLLAIPQ